MDMTGLTNYAWLTAGIATVGVLWGHVRGIFDRFRSFFVVTCTIDGDPAAGVFLYCRTKMKSSRFDKKHYECTAMYIRPLKKYRRVALEGFGEFVTFFDRGRPFFCSYKRDPQQVFSMNISFIRGTFDIEKILVEGLAMVDAVNTKKENRYSINRHFGRMHSEKAAHDDHLETSEAIAFSETPSRLISRGYRILGWDINDLGLDSDLKPFDALVYPKAIMDFIEIAKHWSESKEFYEEHQIPWRLGAAFHGLPGSGKTSLVRALAQYLDLPIEIFDLPSMSNEELTRNWSRVLNRAPCIVLFEDLDRIFEDGQIKGGAINKPSATLDCLLNCISGVEVANGIMVIVTANDISKLDAALGIPDEEGNSSRPGRLDYAYYLGVLDEDCRYRLASHLLKEHPHLILSTVAAGEGETGAQFQKRCGNIALSLYWNAFNKQKSGSVYLPEECTLN